MTIVDNLEGAGFEDVYHAHHLDTWGTTVYPDAEARGKRDAQNSISHAKKIWQVINASRDVKVISMTREPIARNLSAFFQNIETYGLVEPYDQWDSSYVVNLFKNKYNHDLPTTWFDINFKKFLGIDVYKYPFDFDKRREVLREGRFDVLILRSEDHDSIKEELVSDFLGMEGFSMERRNTAEDKAYSELYNRVKNIVRFPEHALTNIYQSTYMRHFYTDSEIVEFFEKWKE